MWIIVALIAIMVYVIVGGIWVIRQLDRINREDEDKTPDHGSYDDLLKRRRGRSKY